MKSFIKSSLYFLCPLLLLYGYTLLFYVPNPEERGDLVRIAYESYDKQYPMQFSKAFNQEEWFSHFYATARPSDKKTSVLIIGDSFSGQSNYGFRNFLAKSGNIEVFHLSLEKYSAKPIQLLQNLSNGDLFDSIHFDYVVLETVERTLGQQLAELNNSKTLNSSELFKGLTSETEKDNLKDQRFFTDTPLPTEIVKHLIYKTLFHFDDNAFFSDVYKVKLKHSKFSKQANGNQLLFINQDLKVIAHNNSTANIKKLNNNINLFSSSLKKRNTKLIFFVAPDKYDFYYEDILNKEKYTKPLFFDLMDKYDKNYIYLPSKRVLEEATKNEKDVYFYDDTHWSPKAAKIIADTLEKIILK